MIFEQYVLPAICLGGMAATFVWIKWCYGQERDVAVRAKALNEAVETLQSLANIAGKAAAERHRDGLDNTESAKRAFYYQRAVYLVASIPVDRV